MRVLVIGGTKFIGPHVVRLLAESGHQVTVFHRGLHEAEFPPGVQHVHSELAAIPVAAFPEELKRLGPDVVLDMIPIGEQDGQALLRSFQGAAGRVVAISSGDVYRAYGIFRGAEAGPTEPAPLTEQSPLRTMFYPYRDAARGPEDWLYHYDKVLMERAVMGDPVLPATILRLPAVYGPRGDRLLPYLKRMEDRRPAILMEESQARWRWTHGYVENVAAAIALAVCDRRAAGRVYNVGEATTPTTADWVRQIGRAAGWDGLVVALPRERLPAHLRQDYNFAQDIWTDTTRIRTELGYAEPVPLEEALCRTIAWYRAWYRAHPAPDVDYAAEDAACSG